MKKLILFFLVTACLELRAQDSAVTASLREADQYLSGKGKPKDPSKAMELFLQCAGKGNGRAMKEIGMMYKNGNGVKADKEKAIAWITRSIEAGYTTAWYHLGMVYKDETGTRPDFRKVYECFEKGAQAGDEQCIYATAYMHYKGLGCTQDYTLAAQQFKQGAVLGRSNSMYFYGLCFRNGYGVEMNPDSAKYWLIKAAKKGYNMAVRELYTRKAENGEIAPKILAAELKNMVDPAYTSLNKYQKVEHNMSREAVEGEYTGYIIRYDWSGKYPISSSKVALQLHYENGRFTGTWQENDSVAIPMEAVLTPQALVFQQTQYRRADHYSGRKAITYAFDEARLQWKQRNDTMYLSGNITMFSPERNEPEKPLFIVLQKAGKGGVPPRLPVFDAKSSETAEMYRAYPNPVANTITVDFQLKEKTEVVTQLFSIDGKLVYTNNAGTLEAGFYTLPINVRQLAAGTYVLKLQYGKQSKSIQVVKQ